MRMRLLIFSVLEVLAFVGALAAYLYRIVKGLEQIGGTPTSSLAKINFGVRAIETETSHLAPQVTQLNQGLVHLTGQLRLVDARLAAASKALTQRKGNGA